MPLPIRTTVEDINAVCNYLVTKPTGATLAESRAVVDAKRLDGRKLAALRYWGLIDGNEGDRLKVTERGRQCVRDSGAYRSRALRDIVHEVKPYLAAIERSVSRKEFSISATDLAAHWFEHFKEDASESDKILNDQAICFFQIAQGADLGTLVLGRRGMATRFEYDADAVQAFVNGEAVAQPTGELTDEPPLAESTVPQEVGDFVPALPSSLSTQNNKVFVTHGRNQKILEQVKELVAYGRFEPVVAEEQETPAKPVPLKIMDEMRTCAAAVIHVSIDRTLSDSNGDEIPVINGNVLIEIGAAMALYGTRFILLVKDGVELPSNLQGLYECRYEGEELNMPAAMKLLKALSEF